MILRIGLIASLVLACSVAAPGPTTQPTNPPVPTNPPTVAPTAGPTVAPTTEPTPGETAGDGEVPPDALLAADSDPVAGWLGTFCWYGTCLDAPQLPAKSDLPLLDASAGAELTLMLADGTEFSDWSANYAPDSDASGTELASDDASVTTANFPAPPAGDWVLRLFVRFFDGDASYAWHVSVD